MDLFYLDGSDALVLPFSSSVDQVNYEMIPIVRYNLERSDKHDLLSLLSASFTSPFPKNKTHKDSRTLSNQKNQMITFTSDFKLKNFARHVLPPLPRYLACLSSFSAFTLIRLLGFTCLVMNLTRKILFGIWTAHFPRAVAVIW